MNTSSLVLSSSLFCALLSLAACEKEPSGDALSSTSQAAAASSLRSDSERDDAAKLDPIDKKVGYDLRQLRPGGKSLEEAFDGSRARALADGKRVAVLFSADWCAPCKKLEAELGNTQPQSQIGDVRIVMVKEEDWRDATRMSEFDKLRLRWSTVVGQFPYFVLLDEDGHVLEEMKQAVDRLEGEGVEPTVANWFDNARMSSAG